MTSKIEAFESDEYRSICENIKHDARYSRIIFTNGCFDIIHLGHLELLEKCREIAGPKGAVIVGVNSDDSVRRLKGNDRPIIDCDTRCMILMSMRNVDHVVTFDEDTPLKLIESLRPDIIVKGGDYNPKDVIGAHMSQVVIVPLVGEENSTTKIVDRIRNGR